MATPAQPDPYDDDWEDQPGQRPPYQWDLVTLLPLPVLGYGVHVVATGQAAYGRFPMTLHGVNALAFGTAVMSAAVFLH